MTTSPALDPEVMKQAVEDVVTIHQVHGDQCVCGFSSPVSRDRTRHIAHALTAVLPAVIAAAEARGRADGWKVGYVTGHRQACHGRCTHGVARNPYRKTDL